MPNYIQDPNNSKKQIPGPKPDNAYDRIGTVTNCAFTKQPNSVLVTGQLDHSVGFFFGNSASFAEFNSVHSGANAQGGAPFEGMTSSSQYINMLSGSTTGTKLDIHPTAVSGSVNDIGKIMFIYKGGLDGAGRP
jgi:hypothetical protein